MFPFISTTTNKCDNNCSDCIKASNTSKTSTVSTYICTKCDAGYGLVNGDCFQLEPINCNVDNCSLCFTEALSTCYSCNKNYQKTLFGKCEIECFSPNCLKCTDKLSDSCIACSGSFYLKDGKCEELTTLIAISVVFSIIGVITLIILIVVFSKHCNCRNTADYLQNSERSPYFNGAVNNNDLNIINIEIKAAVIENIIQNQRSKIPNNTINSIHTFNTINTINSNTINIKNKNNFRIYSPKSPKQAPIKLYIIDENNNDGSINIEKSYTLDNKNICVVCNQNNGEFKTKCGCYLCEEHKKALSINKEDKENKTVNNAKDYEAKQSNKEDNYADNNAEYKCPKCNINTKIDDSKTENRVLIHRDDSLNITKCGICYESNGDLASCHDECKLKVCRDCHYKILNGSNLCPYCRKQIYLLN